MYLFKIGQLKYNENLKYTKQDDSKGTQSKTSRKKMLVEK